MDGAAPSSYSVILVVGGVMTEASVIRLHHHSVTTAMYANVDILRPVY